VMTRVGTIGVCHVSSATTPAPVTLTRIALASVISVVLVRVSR